MANIKNFLAEKAKRQKDTTIDYKEKIRAHRLSVILRIVLITVVVVSAVVALNITYKRKTYSQVMINSSVPVSVVSGATAKNLNDKLLIYSKDGASCVDSKGQALWNESYEMQSPIVAISGSTVAIGDYNGRTIYVANSSKVLGTIKTNLPIRNLAVSQNGVVAAILDDSDVIRIYLYDGNQDTDEPIVEAKATMNKSGYPIDVSLSPNGKIMMVSYFYVDSGEMKSSISYYNFGEVGSSEIDNFVSGYDYSDAVIPLATFMNNEYSFAVGDDRLVFFRGDEIPENIATAMLSNKILGVYNNESYVGLVSLDNTGESIYKLDTYNASGNKMSTIQFDVEYTDIKYNGDQVIIYGGSDCKIYTVKGVQKFDGQFDTEVSLIIPTASRYRYLLVTGQSLDLVEFN